MKKRRPTLVGVENTLLSRECEMSFDAGEIMSVIRYGVSGCVWRKVLMEVHFNLVIHHAHWENQHTPDSCIELARRSVAREAGRRVKDAECAS